MKLVRAREYAKKYKVLLAFLILFSILIYQCSSPRYESWDCKLILTDKETIEVAFWTKKKMKYGHPHIIEWGGGYERWGFSFDIGDDKVTWEGNDQPRIIDSVNGQFYLITQRLGSAKPGVFGFAKLRWNEISFHEIPRKIAIPNHHSRPFHHGLYNPEPFVCRNERDEVLKEQYEPSHFTEQLWHFLDTGEEKFHVHPDKVNELKEKFLSK